MLYQLSYFRISLFLSGDFGVGLRIFGQSFTEVNSFPHRLSALNSSRNKLRTPLSQCFFRATSAPELWEKMDSNHRRYKPADLQSAPFGHSGILPFYVFFRDDFVLGKINFKIQKTEPMEGIEPTTPRLQITCSGQLSYIGISFLGRMFSPSFPLQWFSGCSLC